MLLLHRFSELSMFTIISTQAYYQHPTTSDPSMATGITRDHGSTGFTSDGGKFVRGSDIPTSTAPSNPSQTQQQGCVCVGGGGGVKLHAA